MSTLNRAEEIARTVHEGQTDLSGCPYIEHPIAVQALMPTEKLKILAYLHDTIEDHPDVCSFESLRSEGFTDDIVVALECLTRRKGERYWDYIRRIVDNDLAVEVKLGDLAHNTIRSRIQNPTEKDEVRWREYGIAIDYLNDVKDFKTQNSKLDLNKPPHCFILHRRLYALLRDEYSALCNVIKHILENAAEAVCPSAVVQGRTKNLDSFTEKCARKASKYGQRHFELMTDLCGTRVILQTTAQVADYCELIKKYFDIDWENSEDTGSRLGNAEFGYISQHFIVSLHPGVYNTLGVEVDAVRFKGMKAEIQVRTFAQHIAADTLHDRMYKAAVQPLKEHEREAAKIGAMLENTDSILTRFVDDFDRFSLNQTSYLSISKIDEELSILDAMNYGENHIFTRFKNALKITGYLRAVGRFQQTEELLAPFIAEEEKGNMILDTSYQSHLWFEYGISLLIDPNRLHSAYQWINKALEHYKWLEDDRSSKWLETRRFYVFMLTTAGILANRKDWLIRALRVDYANPYACAKLLDHTDLEQNLLQAAVSVAENHLRADINEPEVYFVLGRLHLALGEEYTAFRYYTDGLLFYNTKAKLEDAVQAGYMKENKRMRYILEREIPYLDSCGAANALSIRELFSRVHHHIYEETKPQEESTIWIVNHNQILSESAEGYILRSFKSHSLYERIHEMSEACGWLFIEEYDIPLVKAALILGFRVISVNKEMNLQLVVDERIRLTRRLYTLPCEKESLFALFNIPDNNQDISLIEQAAKNGHEKYAEERIAEMRKNGRSTPDLGERTAHWDVLNPTYKRANIDRSSFVPLMLARLGLKLDKNKDGAISWFDIPVETQEMLARAEHGRWNADRVMDGWCYYPVRDNNKKLHTDIVSWEELTEETKKYDFIGIENEIENFASAGLYIHKSTQEGGSSVLK